jgi:hypothetical protein
MKTVTKDSLDLLVALAEDAPNWSGSPMLDISKEQRGNLTQLKREKILTTFKDDGVEFVSFNLAIGESIEVTDGERTFKLTISGDNRYPDVSITPVLKEEPAPGPWMATDAKSRQFYAKRFGK